MCVFEATGDPCSDGDPCTTSDQCTLGVCAGSAQPEPACRTSPAGSFRVRDKSPDTGDLLVWKWLKGDATTLAELGNPLTGTTGYTLCVYDESAGTPSIRLKAVAPAGGTCRGKPCWKALGTTGFKYSDRDLTPDGIATLIVRAGEAGKARAQVKAKGVNLATPALPFAQQPRVTVQLKHGDGMCWTTALDTPVQRNDTGEFKDKIE